MSLRTLAFSKQSGLLYKDTDVNKKRNDTEKNVEPF